MLVCRAWPSCMPVIRAAAAAAGLTGLTCGHLPAMLLQLLVGESVCHKLLAAPGILQPLEQLHTAMVVAQ
jgi:hypothetical protein